MRKKTEPIVENILEPQVESKDSNEAIDNQIQEEPKPKKKAFGFLNKSKKNVAPEEQKITNDKIVIETLEAPNVDLSQNQDQNTSSQEKESFVVINSQTQSDSKVEGISETISEEE